jgi:hypothetical protein
MDKPNQTNAKADANDSDNRKSMAPYETALNKALDKLHSEVLIYLLAYLILLIGLSVYGTAISTTLRNLLYIIPILGVLAYSWSKKRSAVKKSGVNVAAGIARSGAYVGGIRGDARYSEPVDVKAGIASGHAQVVGVDVGPAKAASGNDDIFTVFQKLNEKNRNEIHARSLELYSRQLRGKE